MDILVLQGPDPQHMLIHMPHHKLQIPLTMRFHNSLSQHDEVIGLTVLRFILFGILFFSHTHRLLSAYNIKKAQGL